MKETKFIEQNQQKWSEYEQMLQTGHRDPEKLNDLFVQITDDLSYARTFYPNRSVKVYLNHMAQRIFHHIYKGKRFPASRLVKFWTDQLPQVMWESRRAMQLSLALFVLAFSIGVLSSIINPDFARVILGNEYVDMTLANIEKGDPMAVYKQSESFGMTAGIAANNLFVALKTAIFGVLASIGTAFMMIYNGIMVGAFQYFFIERGLFWPSFLTIWIHGTLEISAIIIAGGAGMTAGSGLLFPGTFSRTQAFQISMRRGLKIFIGIVPVIILAAFFEGFLTRFTETPDVLRGFFILASLAFILGYFVWLPIKKARSGSFEEVEKDADLPPDLSQAIDFNAIKTSGTIISNAFTIISRHLGLSLGLTAASSLLFTALSMGISEQPIVNVFRYESSGMGVLNGLRDFFGENYLSMQRWIAVSIWFLVALTGFRITEREMLAENRSEWSIRSLPSLALLMLPIALQCMVWTAENGFWIWMGGVLLFPALTHWMAAIRYEPERFWNSLTLSLKGIKSWTSVFSGFLITNLLMLFLLFMDSELWTILIQFFSWVVPPGEQYMARFSAITTTLTISFAVNFAWLVLVISGILYFFSNRELTEANHLHAQIDQVGTARQIRGLPKE